MNKLILTFCIIGFFVMCGGVQMAHGQRPNEMEIEDFVRQVFIHGVPYEKAVRYSSDDALRILDMLHDGEAEQFWANILIVASIAGDERVVEPIINFIESRQRVELNQIQYNAKTSAIMALGYLVNHNESREALDYLIESLDPEIWRERGIDWRSSIHNSESELFIQLSTMAVLGLGLSGNEEAEEALQTLEERTNSELGQTFIRQLNGTLEEALDANQTISEVGLAQYYQQSEENWRNR